MSLAILWFIVLALLWCGFLFLEGFDLRRRHAALLRRPQRRRTARGDQLDRPRVGRQRGLADRGRGRHVRRLPRVVRHHVLGLLPGARRGARGAHHPRRLVRVPRAGARRRLAAHLGRHPHRGQLPHSRARRRAPWATCCAACRSTPTTSTPAAFFTLLNPYSLFVGITVLLLCLAHGATFLALKTEWPRARPRRAARAACLRRSPRSRSWASPSGRWPWSGHAVRAPVPVVAVRRHAGGGLVRRARTATAGPSSPPPSPCWPRWRPSSCSSIRT